MFKSTITRLTAVIILTVSFCFDSFSQKAKINWLDIGEADSLNNSRPVLIDLFTDWCGWCKVMDQKTYTNAKLAGYVSEKFQAVKVDAETRSAIKWKGRTFKYSPAHRANEFAVYVTNGRLAFPTTVIIPAGGGEPQAIPGYLKPGEMEVILKYFGEEAYKNTSFATFKKRLKPEW